MVSTGSFSSNIDQVAREIKETNKRTAAGVRRAIRKTVAITAQANLEAIKAAAAAEELKQAEAATKATVSFNLKGSGAVIRTSLRSARYARALELGSKGSGGAYDRHPVFQRGGLRPGVSGPLANPSHFRNKGGYTVAYYNQPLRPYFFRTAEAMEPFNDATLNAALDVALEEAGWHGVQRATAAKAAQVRRVGVQKAARKRSLERRRVKEAAARQREFHRVFGTTEQKAAVRKYEAERVARAAARRKKRP